MSMTPSRRTLDRLTIGDLAVDNRLVVVRCHLCRKTENYLAVDLVTVMGAGRKAHEAFTVCPHCGKSQWLSVRFRMTTFNDEGRLRIRKPVAKRVWQWTDAIYEGATSGAG